MRARILAVVALLGLLGVIGCSSLTANSASPTLVPLQPGWEQLFKLEWQVGEHRGKPVLSGYLLNDSPYTVTLIRLLVDGLDDSGAITAQRVSWLPGGSLSPFTRTYFEAQTPGRYARYQVRVFAYDRVEAGGDGGAQH